MEWPARKHIRLKEYDYAVGGAYFVTICTRDRACILSEIKKPVGPDALIGPQVCLTEIGKVVDQYIRRTDMAYPTVKVEQYVIMPNHIHLLLIFENDGPMRASGPTLSRVVKAVKSLTTRSIGCAIWQDNYHEHIIRDENDFLIHWQYIGNNPALWEEDEYFGGQQ